MTDLSAIAADPNWLPHEIDPNSRRVRFLKIDRTRIKERDFLANLDRAEAEEWASFEDVLEMRPNAGPVSFIFHSGFCRSTLLLHALDKPGVSLGLNEPGVLNSLAGGGRDLDLTKAIVDLLSRQHVPGEQVVIKLSNYPNVLIPGLMQARPTANAILVTNDLKSFLEAVVRKGLTGRQWGRQVCLVARTYAGNLDHLSIESLAGLTDLQLAGLGWLLTQNWFDEHLNGQYSERLRMVHSDTFNDNRAKTIKAAARHFGLDLGPQDVAAIVNGPVFASHAKVGGDYAAKEALDRKRSSSAVNAEEMAQVEDWIGQFASASRLKVPVPENLL